MATPEGKLILEVTVEQEWAQKVVDKWEYKWRAASLHALKVLQMPTDDEAGDWIDKNLPPPPHPELLTGYNPLPPPPLEPFKQASSPPAPRRLGHDHPIRLHLFGIPSSARINDLADALRSIGITFHHGELVRLPQGQKAFITVPGRAAWEQIDRLLPSIRIFGQKVCAERCHPGRSQRGKQTQPTILLDGLDPSTTYREVEDVVRKTRCGAFDVAFNPKVMQGRARAPSPDTAQRMVQMLDGLDVGGGQRIRASWVDRDGERHGVIRESVAEPMTEEEEVRVKVEEEEEDVQPSPPSSPLLAPPPRTSPPLFRRPSPSPSRRPTYPSPEPSPSPPKRRKIEPPQHRPSASTSTSGASLPPLTKGAPSVCGPSGETAAFAQDAKQLLEKAQQRCAELERVLGMVGEGAGGAGVEGSGGACERLRERCSTHELLDETNRLASNGSFSQDLRTLLRKRWMPVDEGPGPARKRRKRQATEEVVGEGAVEGAGSGKVTAEGEAQGERKEEGDEDAALKLVAEVEAVGPSFLRGPALKTIEPFLRKTKKPDYNSLSDILVAKPLSQPNVDTSSSPDPLSNLLYTLTFQPVSRYTVIGIGRHRHRLYQTPQRQVLVCLGSTTLWEIVQELQASRERVPREGTPDPSDAEENDEEDEEQEDEMIGQGRPVFTGNFGGSRGGKEKKKREVRWQAETKATGSCFCIEDVLYADGDVDQKGKVDYAKMIHDLVGETEWPSAKTPQLTTGATMQAKKLGEVDGLRIGQPYWFLTGGNVEVVWSVDEICYRHPLDPAATSPSSSYPYPLTTFLSRAAHSSTSSLSSSTTSASGARCRICDRDPSAFILLNDELVGETPALVCEPCLEALHPREKVEDGEDEDAGGGDPLTKGRLFMGGEEEGGGTRVRIVPVVL
ncbi:hypothetical protein JCM6882_000654 [Rhodosporidiobolus microsporus]